MQPLQYVLLLRHAHSHMHTRTHTLDMAGLGPAEQTADARVSHLPVGAGGGALGPVICNDGRWALSEEARLPAGRGTHEGHGCLIKCPPEEG